MLRELKLLIIVSLMLSKSVFAQTDNDQIEFTAINGIKVFTPNKYAIQGQVWGGELGYHFNMDANKANYARVFNLKSIDIIASYRNLHSLTINGESSSKGSLGNA